MPLTTGYSFGDVVLVPFPFTDQSGSKKRPAVIVSSADYQAQRRDLVIMAITSTRSSADFRVEAVSLNARSSTARIPIAASRSRCRARCAWLTSRCRSSDTADVAP
jgi:mRNA-degrading endonuclease toxin of MazEF toxin-antitoxin module